MAENPFNLEMFLREYFNLRESGRYYSELYNEFWGQIIRIYLDNSSREFVRRGYSSELGEQEFFNHWGQDDIPESVMSVINMIKATKGKPEAKDIKDTILFVLNIYSGNYIKNSGGNSYYAMFINRLKRFKDQDLVYKACAKLEYSLSRDDFRSLNEDVRKDIAVMKASNKNATVEDIGDLIRFCKTSDEAIKIINDVFAKTDEDIDKIMAKDVPNGDRLSSATRYPLEVIKNATNHEYKETVPGFRDDLRRFADVALDKYNVSKILGSGDAEYITVYEDTLDKKYIELQNRFTEQNEELKVKDKSANLQEQVIAELNAKIDALESELNKERSRRIDVENKLRQSNDTVNRFEKAREKLTKAGMFERKKIIEEMNDIGVKEL